MISRIKPKRRIKFLRNKNKKQISTSNVINKDLHPYCTFSSHKRYIKWEGVLTFFGWIEWTFFLNSLRADPARESTGYNKAPTNVKALSFKYGARGRTWPSLLSEEDAEFFETPFSNYKSLDQVRLLATMMLKLKLVFSFFPEPLWISGWLCK